MGIGSILVGAAVALVVAAYVARPLRTSRAAHASEQLIEQWVAQVRNENLPAATPAAPEPACFCARCGQRARAGDRFCSRCGAALPAEDR